MLFCADHWPLVQRLRADKEALMAEFAAAMEANATTLKANTRTLFGEPLYSAPIPMLPYVLDPRLWDKTERLSAGNPPLELMYPGQFKKHVGMAIVRDFPCIRQMNWTTLDAGAKVNEHYGVGGVLYRKVPDHLRLQMCWHPGEKAVFSLRNEYVEYVEDLCFGFHDGMELHRVENNGSLPRTVLILDVWKNQVGTRNVPHSNAVRRSK